MTLETSSKGVTIVGGGLCGLALACALKKRNIPFNIYEARASFAEIGAGINLGPNLRQALQLIDEELAETIRRASCSNPVESVWMQVRLGAATSNFQELHLLTELLAPPSGNASIHRSELLEVLADWSDARAHTRFNKKVVAFDISRSDRVLLRFADGTQDSAAVVIACDGIHSASRQAVSEGDNSVAAPQYADSGAYRAVPSVNEIQEIFGQEIAHYSNVIVGPNGYLMLYPVNGGEKVNVGFWTWRRSNGQWAYGENWVMPNEGAEMQRQFAAWGEQIHRLMTLIGDAPFFATHYHPSHLPSLFRGRLCIMGDAAHSMPPHQGAGAGQAMEDVHIMADLLHHVRDVESLERGLNAAFTAYDTVRKPRAYRMVDTSQEALSFWTEFWRQDLDQKGVETFVHKAEERFRWVWNVNLEEEAKRARLIVDDILDMR